MQSGSSDPRGTISSTSATQTLPAIAQAATTMRRDSPSLIPDRATICRCNGVTKGDIRTEFASGATTLEQVAESTRATTGCGECTDAVCGILDWLGADAVRYGLMKMASSQDVRFNEKAIDEAMEKAGVADQRKKRSI